MSDLDDNLTSILSSLIDTDGIEAPNTNELPIDNAAFSDSRLDFDNLASCITGNDASLHQSSDENVSSLLESHLNELAHAERSNIVSASTENLDDVAPFDLDKPIESLLESTPTEFISQECTESHNSILEKDAKLQCSSTHSNPIQNETQESIDSLQPLFSAINSNGVVSTNSKNQTNTELSSTIDECNENDLVIEACNDVPTPAQPVEIETNSHSLAAIEINANANVESQENDLAVESSPIDEELPIEEETFVEDEVGETIIADEIIDEAILSKELLHDSKKRRRILVYGESDNSELEEERERLLHSKSPTPSHQSNEHSESGNHDQDDHLSDEYTNMSDDQQEDNFDDYEEEDDYIRDPNERPGPKSKKRSTHLYNALKAKALLESAVVIPARKKKKRVIDSDDEYNNAILNQPIDSADDIGLIPDLPPFNVVIKRDINVETIPNATKLKVGHAEEQTFIKVEPISRAATQIKMEKYNANNNRRSSRKKEPKDIFEMPLNA